MSLEGATVLVIGGSSGIGLATAQLARKAGADVAIAARNPERLAAAAREIGETTRTFAVDVADEAAVRAMIEGLPRLDHLVMLAGEQPAGALVDTDSAEFRRSVEVRFWGSLYACKYAAPRMGRGASIVLCSGVSAHRPQAKRAVGAATTAAIEAFAKALALELAPIRVNVIIPGAIDTPVLDRYFGSSKDTVLAQLADRVLVGRVGEPDDVAHAIVFLMENGYVTATTLLVDGGLLAT